MNFDLTEEQAAMERVARDFAEKEIVPRLKKEEFDRELVSKMGKLGLFGCAFPEGMGGSQAGFLAHSVVCEQISTYDSGLRSLFNLQAMTVPYTIMEWGRPEVRRRFVPALVGGGALGCTCFSEPDAGSDIAAIRTGVVDAGDHFLINGTKTWISNGTVAEAAVVYCTFDRSLRHKGLCAIAVDTRQPGWQPREIPKLGDKASPIAEVFLENVSAPKENLLGEWGGGFQVAMTALDRGRISVGSGAVGLSQACLNASLKYAKERIQFGRPIAEYQMVKQILADMVAYTEAARFLVRRGAWLNDQGRPFTREIAIAKYFAGEAAVRAAGWAMEIHGGMGYSLELPVEKYYRDSKLYQVGEGTANIMRLLIADDALGQKKANRPRLKTPADFRDLS
ncbi:MAG: acyl-CoA dehydrogenase family protein [Deltaproteobacteria bacterium]|nr:acyl-CoA dehydrogenase family protein [Deltaproteobacteria bacterium]